MNKENLLKMADYLETLEPEKFDIGTFNVDGDEKSKDVEHLCGSVGCVIGHAPRVFGVEEEDYKWCDYNYTLIFRWSEYSKRLFEVFDIEWSWCFSGGWESTDNTPKGAALRIRYLVENGCPEDSLRQLLGTATYMFKEQLDKTLTNIK